MFGGFYLWICTSVYQWWWSSTILLFCSGSTNDAIMLQISGDVAKSACTKDIYWTWTHQTCIFKKWNDPDWNANYKERSQFKEKKKRNKIVIPIFPQNPAESCSQRSQFSNIHMHHMPRGGLVDNANKYWSEYCIKETGPEKEFQCNDDYISSSVAVLIWACVATRC